MTWLQLELEAAAPGQAESLLKATKPRSQQLNCHSTSRPRTQEGALGARKLHHIKALREVTECRLPWSRAVQSGRCTYDLLKLSWSLRHCRRAMETEKPRAVSRVWRDPVNLTLPIELAQAWYLCRCVIRGCVPKKLLVYGWVCLLCVCANAFKSEFGGWISLQCRAYNDLNSAPVDRLSQRSSKMPMALAGL